jgi:hypothetical protein
MVQPMHNPAKPSIVKEIVGDCRRPPDSIKAHVPSIVAKRFASLALVIISGH